MVCPLGNVRIVSSNSLTGIGNTSPAAEFNIQVDPEAAKVVFECGVPVTMVPLEVTHTVMVREEPLDRNNIHECMSR